MNGSAKRLMAVFAVTVMVASAAVVIFADAQDSSADTTDYKKYYRGQLTTEFERNAYDAIANATTFGPFDIDLAGAPSDSSSVSDGLAKAITAAGYDNPLVNYYFRSYTYSYGSDPIKVTPGVLEAYSGARNTYDTAMTAAIAAADGSVDKTSDFTKIKSIHDYVANTLEYDTANMNSTDPQISGNIRSVYTSLCGDHLVVCEGYAKMFKVLCDAYDIPCIIISGNAGTTGSLEAHMWNNVYLGGYWFLVDCTWDDQSGEIRYEYFLAGANKTGFNGIKVGNSHIPDSPANACGLEFPVISALSIDKNTGTIEGGTQYTVTFKFMDSVYKTQYVAEGGLAVLPAEPTKVGWRFMKWTAEGSDEAYDFTKAVTSNLTLVAVGTDKPVFVLTYDTQGGSSIQNTIVETEISDGVRVPVDAKITKSVPVRDGFKFLGWSTSKNKDGMMYNPDGTDIEVTLVDDCTLYAVWEDQNSIGAKIDSFADRAAKFLSDETIPGVSNLLLTIGVITSLISLLAILAIARK